MPETAEAVVETKPDLSKIVSLGKPQREFFAGGKKPDVEKNTDAESAASITTTEEGKTSVSEEGKDKNTTATKDAVANTVEITDAQRKALLKEMFGDENTDIEAIKEKLKPAPAELTEEEKKKVQSEKELRQAKLFIDGGGTMEQFNAIKSIATTDIAEFSKKEALSELIAAGFTEKEAGEIVKERYYQIERENIAQDFDNETDEEFAARKAALQKKVEYGTKKLNGHSAYKQAQAVGILKGLADAIEAEEAQVKEEAVISSNVDELLSKLPRNQTFELGKHNDVNLDPVLHEVSEDSIKQVAEVLKDPTKRNNFFKNQDGTLNLQKLTEVLINNFEMKRAVKAALLEGQSRQVAEFQKTFPNSPFELGVGGATQKNNQKGAVTSAGKPVRVSPQNN